MKKLLEKDKRKRFFIKCIEKKNIIFKNITRNLNISTLVRVQALSNLYREQNGTNSKTSLSHRCILSCNKKRYNKFTKFSRHIYLKCIRFGKVYGYSKSSW